MFVPTRVSIPETSPKIHGGPGPNHRPSQTWRLVWGKTPPSWPCRQDGRSVNERHASSYKRSWRRQVAAVGWDPWDPWRIHGTNGKNYPTYMKTIKHATIHVGRFTYRSSYGSYGYGKLGIEPTPRWLIEIFLEIELQIGKWSYSNEIPLIPAIVSHLEKWWWSLLRGFNGIVSEYYPTRVKAWNAVAFVVVVVVVVSPSPKEQTYLEP